MISIVTTWREDPGGHIGAARDIVKHTKEQDPKKALEIYLKKTNDLYDSFKHAKVVTITKSVTRIG